MQFFKMFCRLAMIASLLVLPATLPGAELKEGMANFEAGQFDAARENFKVALEEEPGNGQAAFMLGRIALEQYEIKDAIRWFQRATELEPESSRYHQYLGEALGRLLSEAGTLTRMRKGPDMRKAFATAVELDPENLEARMGLVSYYLNAPKIGGGGRDKAEAEARRIAEIEKQAGHEAWLQIYLHVDELDAALLEVEQLRRMDPGNEKALLLQGLLLTRQEKFEPAAAHFEAWLAREPEQMQAAYQLGRISALSGLNPARGEAAMLMYLQHRPGPDDPPLAWAHFRLGQIYEHMARADAARKAYRAAMEADPKHKEAREALKKLGN